MAMYFVSIYRSTLLIGRFVFELFSDIRALFMAHKRYLSSSFAVMQEKVREIFQKEETLNRGRLSLSWGFAIWLY